MHKGVSERMNFLQRVASHSTKGFANGRVDVLPPDVRQKEVAYQDVYRQYHDAKIHLKMADEELACINAKLKNTQPFKEFQRLTERRNNLVETANSLRTTIGQLKIAARLAGEKSYGALFRYIAELRLHRDLFRAIDEETQKLIGRSAVEGTGRTKHTKAPQVGDGYDIPTPEA